MRHLCIFDVSPFCHAGAVNKYAYIEGPVRDDGNGYHSTDIPAGGPALLFNKIYELLPQGCDMVFCCDRNPTIKKAMLASYKSNRKHTVAMEHMKEVTERILKDCGFLVLAEDGYEADDFIYSLVQRYKGEYDKISIYTGDSDLCFLVDEVVSIEPSSSRAKHVDIHNYETIIKKGYRMPYNSCTMDKILYGDTSDCIPGLPTEQREQLKAMVYTETTMTSLGDKQFVHEFLELVAPWAIPQADLVFPLDVRVPDELDYTISKDKVNQWGYLMHCKSFKTKVPISDDTKCVHADMIEDGLYSE